MASFIPLIDAKWHHHFDNLQMSSNDFYSSLEEIIIQKELPKVKISRVTLAEAGLLSADREYLRVQRYQYVFDICAAPFGKEFFISWWLGENTNYFGRILSTIPLIDKLLGKSSKERTYYQIDSLTMFKESIHAIILQLVDSIAEGKGLRRLSETDRQIIKEVLVK